MRAIQDFFSTDYGLLSALVLLITIGMGVFYVRYFMQHFREDCAREDQRLKQGA